MTRTNAQRAADSERTRREQGYKPLRGMIDPATQVALARICQAQGCTQAEAIKRAVTALSVTLDTNAPDPLA